MWCDRFLKSLLFHLKSFIFMKRDTEIVSIIYLMFLNFREATEYNILCIDMSVILLYLQFCNLKEEMLRQCC